MLAASDLELPAHVRACVTGDWIVFLDLRGDRYWALPCTMPRADINARLNASGLRDRTGPTPRARLCVGEVRLRRLPDPLLLFACGFWASRIVDRGLLERAFTWVEQAKRKRALHGSDASQDLSSRFAQLRPWLPWRYVCLFNGLCLTRFLIERGQRVDLVFGVRARPFAAHCWVEAQDKILDAGGEDCASFTEIARV